ncbi:mediator of RNA polymerase II transcription subunit 25-like [Cajanus cajan]|uniref:mediator of RNA polymerase II transcription subunit 25-like n=1 Tax=Cajanus cajan TaxID=3821 RepID=UPI0010FB5AAE|nr:mediator of RNA polymerase II transcription subunit 25-like [Cajanus cajan]
MVIKDYVKAWEGCLVGRVHSYRACLNQARVMAKPTSPSSLTSTWSSRLEITIFIPIKAVNYTLRIIGGPIDYVFFHITQFNNFDVYDHLMSKSLCAKIELPSHIIILSTTESKHHFLGIIFPRDTIFVEPV